MPPYVFLCQNCYNEFLAALHIGDLEKVSAVGSHCGGKRVAQQLTEFSAVAYKKS